MFLTEEKIRNIIREQLLLENAYSEALAGSMAYVAVLTMQIRCLVDHLTGNPINPNNILINFLKNANQQSDIVYNQQLGQLSGDMTKLINTLYKQHNVVMNRYNSLINSSKGMRNIVAQEFSGILVVQYSPDQGTITSTSYTSEANAKFLMSGQYSGAMSLEIQVPQDFMDPNLVPTPAVYKNIEKIKGILKGTITHEFVHAGQAGSGKIGITTGRGVSGTGPVQDVLNNNFAGYSFVDTAFPLIGEFTEVLYEIISQHFSSGSTQNQLSGLENMSYGPQNHPFISLYYFLAENMIRNFSTEEFEAYVRGFKADAESRAKSSQASGQFKKLVDAEYSKIVKVRMKTLFNSFGPMTGMIITDIPTHMPGYTPDFQALESEAVNAFLQKYKQIFG